MWLRIFFCCLFYLVIRLAWGQPNSLSSDHRDESKSEACSSFESLAPVQLHRSTTAYYERRIIKLGNHNNGTLWFREGCRFQKIDGQFVDGISIPFPEMVYGSLGRQLEELN